MPLQYEFFDHTADIGVRVFGESLEALFVNAARAIYAALGEFVTGPRVAPKSVRLQADSREDLLHDWLGELLFDLETQHVLYDQIEVTGVTASALTASLQGGVIDFARSHPRDEIKAVTYHQLRIEQKPDGTWQATIIFDV